MSCRPQDSRARRIVAWLERPAPRSWSLFVFLVALGALVLYGVQLGDNQANTSRAQRGVNQLAALTRGQQTTDRTIGLLISRVTGDEQATCRIQQRGLPASHQLVSVVVDINRVLTAPLSRAQRAAQKRFRPTRKALVAFRALERAAVAYVRLARQVPASRSC